MTDKTVSVPQPSRFKLACELFIVIAVLGIVWSLTGNPFWVECVFLGILAVVTALIYLWRNRK